ncbi:hypothetical protein KR50_11840 [Jeotgalibacillus campisalis]|uniref:Uncharacterized protein n=1 Tax=Jeotgalibacillus campisalis TaxID=220754 RepID=A0A0C2S557_9BACL|nr:hypothetical protein KR50_11840 [Jeotgalibacillus campisalis]
MCRRIHDDVLCVVKNYPGLIQQSRLQAGETGIVAPSSCIRNEPYF